MWEEYKANCLADVLVTIYPVRSAFHDKARLEKMTDYLKLMLVARPVVLPAAILLSWFIHMSCGDGLLFAFVMLVLYGIAFAAFFIPSVWITDGLNESQSVVYLDRMHRCFIEEAWTWITYLTVPFLLVINFTLLGASHEELDTIFGGFLAVVVLLNWRMVAGVAARQWPHWLDEPNKKRFEELSDD